MSDKGIAAQRQLESLAKVFDLRSLRIGPEDQTSFNGMVTEIQVGWVARNSE